MRRAVIVGASALASRLCAVCAALGADAAALKAAAAERVGYPLLIKAVAGGGGVESPEGHDAFLRTLRRLRIVELGSDAELARAAQLSRDGREPVQRRGGSFCQRQRTP